MSFKLHQTLSRRNFMRGLGVASVAVAAPFPALASASPSAFPGGSRLYSADATAVQEIPQETVIISSNENPLGPSQGALAALGSMAAMGGRYHSDETMKTVAVFNDLYGLKHGYTAMFPGSGGALDLALMSNIGPDRPLVYGDPSYEQGPRAADTMKAPKFPVKLTSTYAHDVKAMLAATPKAGAYYIVNPNNPTGTITPREDILWLLKNKPKGSVVIVDEAYLHFSDQDSVIDQVAADQDLIVLRTFSKIYGMAGLRAGFAVARPDLLMRFLNVATPARTLASVSIATAAAARASLEDPELVPLRKKINSDVRAETLEFLDKKGYKYVAGSQANFFMVDVGRPGKEFQLAMMQNGIAIGRSWAAMPNHVRVTVGTKAEMARFQTAFVRCMDAGPVVGAELHFPSLERIPSELLRA
ncbi:MAG TPA: aminotransferase class I/II-fold pyridoxal phosphate-dependent enzyme [Granulicella sp.]